MKIQETQEGLRLTQAQQHKVKWRKWGSYLTERQWSSVREDYSANGDAWAFFPHDHARSRTYRWGEDGIAGVSDDQQRLCFALSFWNGEDAILKERMFGLTNTEGNHGEDVKEYYFYLDNTPTHSYMKYLYKYPHGPFPYSGLIAENGRRKAFPGSFEYELLDTGVFANDSYFDVLVEYAKHTPEDLLIHIRVTNRGSARKTLHLLPTLWFRNTWSWFPHAPKPVIREHATNPTGSQVIEAVSQDEDGGTYWLFCQQPQEILYTENETNRVRFGWGENTSAYVKDAFDRYVVHGEKLAVNPAHTGTKAAAYYRLEIEAGATATVQLRLTTTADLAAPFDAQFASALTSRQREADEFYQAVSPLPLSEDMRHVQRQAFAGMLWGKQVYTYSVQQWLVGDPAGPVPPEQRKASRNHDWGHVFTRDVISMPDTWEYPWFAAWDLAFHTISLAMIDPDFAKQQLVLLTGEWYMHPNGELPAYEWSFDDVNPPVHAWAAWRVYKIEEKLYGQGDRLFLERMFRELIFYFTWWLNRKDRAGNNLFQGGFLGLDNIGPFNRSTLPPNIRGYLDQSDGTSWMGMYCLNMLRIALELSASDKSYQAMAAKFLEHFLLIANAMNNIAGNGESLWDEMDGFYYDVLHLFDGQSSAGKEFISLKVRSVAGLVSLFAVEAIDQKFLQAGFEQLPALRDCLDWATQYRPELLHHSFISLVPTNEQYVRGLQLSLVSPDRLRRILARMLDEDEFLSPHGIRSVSKYHEQHPFVVPGVTDGVGRPYQVDYEPAESRVSDFGGNSNWRGPIWFPMNFLIIESLQKFHRYLGDQFQVACPTGSGKQMTLWEVSMELSRRLMSIFLRDEAGQRPVYGGTQTFQHDPHWRDLILFFEYFHGDNGAGLGASHQTGWTGVVAKLIQQWTEYAGQNRTPADQTEVETNAS